MEPYVYIEYPKCVYNSTGETMTVDNREEEDAARGMGWMTAEEYHSPKQVVPPAAPPVVPPASESSSAPDGGPMDYVPEGEDDHKGQGSRRKGHR
jgi:hypothetical protein